MAENAARQQVKALTDRLEEGVRELFDSQKFADYLKTMARFHRYSARNVLLIHMQMPQATRVAGYRAWLTEHGRQVKRGEKGIRILAPTPFTIKKEQPRLDPQSGQPVMGRDGLPETEEVEIRIPRFKAIGVFDVSQTDGRPLPELAEDIPGDVRQYPLFFDALREVSPLPVVFEDLPENTDGLCRYGREIAIRNGMSERQTISALIHEITHAKIHSISPETENKPPKSRNTEEVEAEGVSYAVCQYYGIETGANSFGYLASWSEGRELKELGASLETIRSTAAGLIDGIDNSFRAIAKMRGIELAGSVQEQEHEPVGAVPPAAAQGLAPAVEPEAGLAPALEPEPVVAHSGANETHPAPDAVFAQYAERIKGLASGSTAYANAVLNADEENARITCEAAVRAAILGLLMESTGHIELYRQYMENPSFKERLEEYIFAGTYLSAHAPQENIPAEDVEADTVEAEAPPQVGARPLLETRAAGATVLMPLVFDEHGQFERSGKRTRVRIEPPIGKYPVYSREQNGRLNGYFLTESGRLVYAADYSRIAEMSETQIDAYFQKQRETLEESLTNPEAWAGYNEAAIANRLEEADAHNIPVRAARKAKRGQASAEKEAQRETGRIEQEAAFSAKLDKMGRAILRGERVEVQASAEGGQNPLLALFARHNIDVPLATRGWINQNLKAFTRREDGTVTAWLPRGKKISDTFMRCLYTLKTALALVQEQEKPPEKEASEATQDKEAATDRPDPSIGPAQRDLYGYTAEDMLPLHKERALELFDAEQTVYLLHDNGSEEIAFERYDIEQHYGIFGIEAADWKTIRQHTEPIAAPGTDEAALEARLLTAPGGQFGIYQLKPGEAYHGYRFASFAALTKAGLAPQRENYVLVYTAPLHANDTPDSIFERFNLNRPEDFTGHSLSVSDVIVMKREDAVSTLYVDSFGFVQLPGFFDGDGQIQAQAVEPERMVADTPAEVPGLPTVAQLEEQVRAGKQISLTDLANALKRERRDAAGKERPSVLAQLREYQGKTPADTKPQAARANSPERGM